MSRLTAAQIPDIIDSRPLEVLFLYFEQNPEKFTELFEVQPSKKAFEDFVRFSGVGRFQIKLEGQPIAFDNPVQGARTRVNHSVYGLGMRMSREAVRDAQFDVLTRQTKALARSGKDHRERLAYGLINDFSAGSIHLGTDGVSIANAAHPMLKPPTPGQTLSNVLSPPIQLSTEGVEAALITLMNQQSEEGHQIGADLMSGLNLVTGTALVMVGKNVLKAQGRPGTTNPHDINTISDYGINQHVSPYITDPDAWRIIGAKGKNGLMWYENEDVSMNNSTDFLTGDRMWISWYRACVAGILWQAIVESPV